MFGVVHKTIENCRRWVPRPRTQPSSGPATQNTTVVDIFVTLW